MNFVTVQFYNESVFEFDGLVKDVERPLHHTPVLKPEVQKWLDDNVGSPHYVPSVNDSGTTTWRGATFLTTKRTNASPGSGMPLWNVYSKEYRFIFAEASKAMLFKLTWV